MQVGYDTTGGLARGILSAVVNRGGVKYLDDYANRVEQVSLEQVNRAIKIHIKMEEVYRVAAGSIDKEGLPTKE